MNNAEDRNFSWYCHSTFYKGELMRYVGLTGQEPKKRFKNGKGYKKQFFGKMIEIIGWKNFDHEIHSGLTKEEAIAEEIKHIDEWNTTDRRFGFNISKGGDGLDPITKEFRKYLSEINKGALSPVARKVICLNTMKIYPTIVEASIDTHCNKTCINGVCIGRHYSTNNMFFAYYDISFPMEYYKKLFIEKKEEKRKHFFTREHRAKLSKRKSIPVICLETQKIYSSTKQAENELGLHHSTVSRCCKGKMGSSGGFHFAYYKEKQDTSFYSKLLSMVGEIKSGRKGKPVYCVETGVFYKTSIEAKKDTNISSCNILRCCNNERETAGGYHWKYADE